tara:strand:+ start:3618 stop:3884 length:267 start_codon:yes stop_codon:yes gene_type:complete
MKNIQIIIKVNYSVIYTYISDILPNEGDYIKIPETFQKHKGAGVYSTEPTESAGTYKVIEPRTFLAENNKVELHVKNLNQLPIPSLNS